MGEVTRWQHNTGSTARSVQHRLPGPCSRWLTPPQHPDLPRCAGTAYVTGPCSTTHDSVPACGWMGAGAVTRSSRLRPRHGQARLQPHQQQGLMGLGTPRHWGPQQATSTIHRHEAVKATSPLGRLVYLRPGSVLRRDVIRLRHQHEAATLRASGRLMGGGRDEGSNVTGTKLLVRGSSISLKPSWLPLQTGRQTSEDANCKGFEHNGHGWRRPTLRPWRKILQTGFLLTKHKAAQGKLVGLVSAEVKHLAFCLCLLAFSRGRVVFPLFFSFTGSHRVIRFTYTF